MILKKHLRVFVHSTPNRYASSSTALKHFEARACCSIYLLPNGNIRNRLVDLDPWHANFNHTTLQNVERNNIVVTYRREPERTHAQCQCQSILWAFYLTFDSFILKKCLEVNASVSFHSVLVHAFCAVRRKSNVGIACVWLHRQYRRNTHVHISKLIEFLFCVSMCSVWWQEVFDLFIAEGYLVAFNPTQRYAERNTISCTHAHYIVLFRFRRCVRCTCIESFVVFCLWPLQLSRRRTTMYVARVCIRSHTPCTTIYHIACTIPL